MYRCSDMSIDERRGRNLERACLPACTPAPRTRGPRRACACPATRALLPFATYLLLPVPFHLGQRKRCDNTARNVEGGEK